MIALLRYLWRIRNFERIPKLPRGMLSADYETIPPQERRVIARLGARDPLGVRVAMRRRRAASYDDLVAQLKHHHPRRALHRRLSQMLGRLMQATSTHPHRESILQDARESRQRAALAEVERRLEAAVKSFRLIH